MEIYQPSPFDGNHKFHVFLSFRGADVRNTFVDHLYTALSEAGLRVFLDSKELEKGKGIDSSLPSAIETSDVLIPICSKRYAESTWCLEEAARMCRSNGFIIPLFYDVQPCDIRYPRRNGGAFAKAFEKHNTHKDRYGENTIEEWKRALHQISGLSGWSLEAVSGHEGRLVKAVVKGVSDILKKRVPLHVPTHLVDLDWGIRQLINSLHLNSTDTSLVRVGISGIGGVGKTTLAKGVYNEIHRRFDASCFLFNIGATAHNNATLVELQGRILRRLINYEGEVSSVDEGRSLMRDRLRGIRALLILDDVNEREQLLALNGDWFGHGSRVIITSRDQHMLNLAKVDSVFEKTGLGDDDALELFSRHAFCRALPETPFKELSTKVVRACGGHPLALEVIGSHLSDKKEPNDMRCWEEAVHNIGENPDVSRIIRTSYDGLSHVEKEIFLDIACCFVGERKNDADLFWEVLYPNKVQTAIKTLSLKMLINTSGRHFHMHNLLREMGRVIEKRDDNNSRLRLPVGAHKAFNKEIAERMKMLVYTGQNEGEPLIMHNMPSLRYLFLQNTKVSVHIGKLTPNLIWIKIRNCEIVSGNHKWMVSRSQLQLDGSWSEVRILSLESCAIPMKIPNTFLDSLVNLQCLYIQYCDALTTLPSAVGNLSQLKELKLCGCRTLTSLPYTLGNLVKLEELCLGGCADLKSLPYTIGDLSQLRSFNLHGCSGLRILPNTIGALPQLEWLNLPHCSGLQRLPYTVGNLPKLRRLNLHGCSGLGSFHHIVAKLAHLRESKRCAGLGSLVQKKFNVYLGFCEVEEGEALMEDLQKAVRICRGMDDKSLCTESLRVCWGREVDQSRDITWAIDSSDILVPVLSIGAISSARLWGEYDTMYSSNGLVIPFYCQDNNLAWSFCESCLFW